MGALITSFGQAALTGFQKGVAHAARLREIWDDDLTLQVSWADKIELHKEYAEKIHRYLEDNRIEVDLDTFVESEEETSTTHVHNEHRLVMVEEGDMRFWNNVTHTIELTAGDKILIPVTRLHGSTVLSGVCTYHQPIISDDLLK
ncbi:peptide synthetase, partial [Streptomyces sp. SID10244]|nr:peptide synthetase [Streptomyces sp. SID10244]